MRKIALLLAALMVLSLFVACRKEEDTSRPNFEIPNSNVNIQLDDGWKALEDTLHNVEMSKDGVTMTIDSYICTDFVDIPAIEELFADRNYILFRELSGQKEIEAPETYTSGTKTIICAMYSAQGEEGVVYYYCFGVDFHDQASSMAWVCLSGAEKNLKNQRAELKATVESMVTDGKFQSQEEIDAILSGDYVEPDSEQEVDSSEPEQEVVPSGPVQEAVPSEPEQEVVPSEPEQEVVPSEPEQEAAPSETEQGAPQE